jgi:hypothetical protein
MAAMRDDTPYHARPAGEVLREQDCMRTIFREAPEAEHIWEAFAGTGVTAEVLRERFPRAVIEATDLDDDCVQTYNAKGYGRAYQEDALAHMGRRWSHFGDTWGVSLDYNKFTLFDLRETRSPTERWKLDLLRGVLARRPRWIQLTDSACRYLHLNWGNYELPLNSLDHYVVALERELRAQPYGEAYRLRAWDKHHAASYHLFVSE